MIYNDTINLSKCSGDGTSMRDNGENPGARANTLVSDEGINSGEQIPDALLISR